MLGRKQSLKGEPVVLADYGPEESLNESADIEWVNKVCICILYVKYLIIIVSLVLIDHKLVILSVLVLSVTVNLKLECH